MKYQEALEIIKDELPSTSGIIEEALGLVEKCVNKQTLKKVILGYDEQDLICCPNCKRELMSMDWYDHFKCNYCEICGQALDWSDTE